MRDVCGMIRRDTRSLRRGLALGLVLGGLFVLMACGDADPPPSDEGPRFVTTIPPFEMIVAPIVEGRGTVDRLLEPGASPHTYDPTPSDLRSVANASALIYGDAHLDGWAADLSSNSRVALAGLVPQDARLRFDDGHGHGTGTVDPHFWTDPQAVRALLPALVDTLCALDARGCSVYQANADSFASALAALDTRVEAMMEPVRDTPVLLAQPFFRYFLHRYRFRLVGVVEPRPGAEPTPGSLHMLVQNARTSGARFILTQQSLSERAARTVAESSALPLVRLDLLGGTEGRDSYAQLLLGNARVLREALAPSGSEPSQTHGDSE